MALIDTAERFGDWLADVIYSWRCAFWRRHPEFFGDALPPKGRRNRDKFIGGK